MLGSAEDNTALSRALSQLAEVEDKMEQLHQDQAANDTFSFAELIADFIRLLGAVRVGNVHAHSARSRSGFSHRNTHHVQAAQVCSLFRDGGSWIDRLDEVCRVLEQLSELFVLHSESYHLSADCVKK